MLKEKESKEKVSDAEVKIKEKDSKLEGAVNRRKNERRTSSNRRIKLDGDEKKEHSSSKEKKNLKKEKELKKEIEERNLKIGKLEDEIASIKDLLQRRQADFENYKKRNARQQEDFKKYAIKNMAFDIIAVNDDFHRAIEASSNIQEGQSIEEAHKSFVEGVSMISKRIEDTLEKYGVSEIEALNTEFDPNVHEAVEIEESEDVDIDTVTKVHQKGFYIGDQVLRNAIVKVTKSIKKNDENIQSEKPEKQEDEEKEE